MLRRRIVFVVVPFVAALLLATVEAHAGQISLAWDANPEPDIAGYIVEWGTAANPYANATDVGNVTAWTLVNAVDGTTYSFRVVAYNRAGERSDPSAAVSGAATGTTPEPSPSPSPNPSPAPAPTPAVSAPDMWVDAPADKSVVGPNFAIAGWAIDKGAASATGVDRVDVWAYPNPGSNAPPVFLGSATYGSTRSDLVAYAGAQFAASGFSLSVQGLPAGTYDLAVFAHSVVAGAFNAVRVVRVSVGVQVSQPQLVVDAPVPNSTVGTKFLIGGWAVDRASASGPGVNAVHVWAYPTNGGAPVFVGAAATGGIRPDVAGVLGKPFETSGYSVNGTLAVGDYNLVIFAQSTVTGTFNNSLIVPVRVR